MVEIFKTNVSNHLAAQQIIDKVKAVYKDADVSFDLDDCDRIFRFYATDDISEVVEVIAELFKSVGFSALALNDENLQANQQESFFSSQSKVGINVFLSFI